MIVPCETSQLQRTTSDSFIVSTTVVRVINLERRMLYPEIEKMEDATSSMALGIDLTEVVSE